MERYIRVKSIKAELGKKILSCSIINIIRSKYLRALKRLNKDRKYGSDTFKNRNNKFKKLFLLGHCLSK